MVFDITTINPLIWQAFIVYYTYFGNLTYCVGISAKRLNSWEIACMFLFVCLFVCFAIVLINKGKFEHRQAGA